MPETRHTVKGVVGESYLSILGICNCGKEEEEEVSLHEVLLIIELLLNELCHNRKGFWGFGVLGFIKVLICQNCLLMNVGLIHIVIHVINLKSDII